MIKYLIAFLFLTASAGACKKVFNLEYGHYFEQTQRGRPDIYCKYCGIDRDKAVTFDTLYLCTATPRCTDTTRFYAKVDTVWGSTRIDTVLVNCMHLGWCACVIPPWVSVSYPLRIDTTWLPKVQVWLDSAEYKRVMWFLMPININIDALRKY